MHKPQLTSTTTPPAHGRGMMGGLRATYRVIPGSGVRVGVKREWKPQLHSTIAHGNLVLQSLSLKHLCGLYLGMVLFTARLKLFIASEAIVVCWIVVGHLLPHPPGYQGARCCSWSRAAVR
jgi:hypothetical protein